MVVSKNTNGTGMFLFVFLLVFFYHFIIFLFFVYFSGFWPMIPIMIVVEFSWIGSYFHPVVHVGVGKIHFRQSERNEEENKTTIMGL